MTGQINEPKQKCGYSPMLLAGEYPHGGLRTNSTQPHGNLNRFKQKITRSRADTVPTGQEESRTNRHETRTGQAAKTTTSKAVQSGQANGSDAPERVAITKPDRTQQDTSTVTCTRGRLSLRDCKQKATKRTACFTFWQRTRCYQVTQTPTKSESWEDIGLVFRESDLRLETRSAFLIRQQLKFLWRQAVLPALVRRLYSWICRLLPSAGDASVTIRD